MADNTAILKDYYSLPLSERKKIDVSKFEVLNDFNNLPDSEKVKVSKSLGFSIDVETSPPDIPTVTVKGDSVYTDKGISVGESPKPIEFPAKELKAFSEGLMKLPANILNKPENRNIYYNTFSQKRNLNPNLVKQVGEEIARRNADARKVEMPTDFTQAKDNTFVESSIAFNPKNKFTIEAVEDVEGGIPRTKLVANAENFPTKYSKTEVEPTVDGIIEAAAMNSPLFNTYKHYSLDPALGMIEEGQKRRWKSAFVENKAQGVLKELVGDGFVAMGLIGLAHPEGFAAFTGAMEHIPGAETVALLPTVLKEKYNEKIGKTPDWVDDAAAVADLVWMHKLATVAKGKYEGYKTGKDFLKSIEELTPEELNNLNDVIQEKRLELGDQYPEYVKSKLTREVPKLIDAAKEIQSTEKGMEEYKISTPPSDLKSLGSSADVMYKGEVGRTERRSSGDYYFVNGEGKSTQIKVADKNNPTQSLAELDIQVLPDVPESVIAKARANSELTEEFNYNSEDYFVSVDELPNGEVEALVFNKMPDGSYKNVLDNHVNPSIGQEIKLEIVNKLLNDKGLPSIDKLKEPIKTQENAIQEPSTAEEISPTVKGGENISEGSEGVRPVGQRQEAPQEVAKEEIITESPTTKTIKNEKENGVQEGRKDGNENVTEGSEGVRPIEQGQEVTQEVAKEEVVENPALANVEATTKALLDATTSSSDYEKITDLIPDEKFGREVSEEVISEEYHKAKADGSNPELVKAVEDILTPKTNKNEKENGIQEGGKDGNENVTEGVQGQGEKGGQEVNKQEVVVAPAEEVVGEEVVSNGVKLEGSPREIIEELKGRKEDNAIHAEIFQSDGYNISIYDNKKTLADKKFKTHEEAKKFLQDWSSKNGNNNKSKYEYGTITDIANFPYRQEITGTLPKDFIDKIKAIEQPLKESSQPQPQKPIVAENEVSASKEVVEPPKVEKTIESVKAEPTIEEVKKTPIETVLEKLKKAEEEYKKLTDSSNLGAISNQEAIIKKQVEIIGIYVEYAKTLIKDGLSTAADLATALKKPLTVEIIRAFDIAKKNREVTEDAIADISKKFGTEVSGGKKNTLNSIDKEYAEGLSNEERLSAAKEEFKKDPIKFEERNDELTNEVLETNISDLKVSINQQAEYLVHIRNIDNKISALENDAAAAYKEGKNKKGLDIEQSINYLQERRAEINEAALKIGSSRGASLQFQRVIADRNFNIVGDIRMLEAKTGKKLSPEQIAEFEAIKKRSDDLVSEMEKLREKLLKNETQDAINAIKNDLEPKKTNKQGIKEELKEKIAARKVRKKELIDGLRKDYFQVFNDATSIGKMFLDKRIIELSKVILEDAADYASFSAEMVKEWGKDIKDYLPKLYKEVGGKEEAVLPSINAKGELQISEQTLRNLVAEGFDTPEKLTDKLYDLISPDLPTVTKEQIEVAYSRYGKQVKETPDVIGDKLREIRQTKKLMLAVKDLILGNLAKRSGKPRPPLTKEQRKLLQEVRARTKDLPLSVEESNKLYASALDTAKRRMQNRIDDLREQIDTNTKRLRAKNVLELDANGKELEAKLKDVQQEFNDTFGKNELTNEQKVDRVLKSLESRIEEAEKQQREGSRTTSEIPSKPVSSDAIKAGKMYIDWLKEAQAELDNASGLAQANAEVAKIKLLDRQIKKYQERTASRDFTPKVKKELDYIEDIAVKERQLEEEKFNYLVEKEKFLIENQSDLNKAGSLMYDILNTARAIMASYDLSAGGRQGAYYLPSYPREFASAWKGMIKDIRSDAAHNDYKYNLKSNKYYKLMKESGLFISDTHPVMKAKEEMYTGHIFNRIEDLRKTAEKQNWVGVPNEMKALLKINEKVAGGINASERAYVGFLNRLRTQIFIKNAELIQSGIRFDTKLFGKKVGMQLTKPSFAKENFKILADIINQGTGRGSITKSAEPLMQVLNWGMFSARFTVSRFTTVLKSLAHAMNPVNKVSATTRLILMKDLATFVATNTTLLYLAQNMFANDKNITVGTNPYDSDTYGTINVNGTNYSLWGGMNKSYAFAAQLYENRKDYGSVKKYETGRGNLAANYFGNKLAPIPGLIYHGVKGKNYRGDDFELSKELPNIFMPMTLSQGLNSKNNIEGRFINAVISGLGADAAERLPDSPYTAKKIAKESVAADRALMIYDALQKFNDKQLKELVMELAKDGGLLGKEDWNMLRVKLRQDDMSVTKVNELQKLYNKNIDIEDKIAATVRGRAEQLDKFFEVYKDDKGLALKKKAGNLKGIKVTDFYKVQDKTVESEFIYALKRAYPNLNGKELRVKYKTIINEYKDANLENK